MKDDKECPICHGMGWYITRVSEKNGKVVDVFTEFCQQIGANEDGYHNR